MNTFVSKKKVLPIFFIFFSTLLFNSILFPQQLSLRQLTFSETTHDGYPYWSPDGKYIIYSSGITRSFCTTMKVPSEGGTPIQWTDYFSQHAQWSPDGSYIIFDGEVGKRVFLASAEGGLPIRVVPDHIPIEKSGMPIWSPDSKTIAFHSKGVLYTGQLSTSEYQKIFSLAGKKILPYDWTKDGGSIYAAALDTATRKFDIWKIPLREGEPKQITFLEGRQTKPSLSPDDSLIVFTSNHGGNADLWIMSSNGGKPIQITFFTGEGKNPGYDDEASWSPDGKRIAFSSTRTEYWAIWVMELDIEYIKEKLKTN